jgi:hypothetical protein
MLEEILMKKSRFTEARIMAVLPPSFTALGEGSHGSSLNGNWAPNRLSSAAETVSPIETNR